MPLLCGATQTSSPVSPSILHLSTTAHCGVLPGNCHCLKMKLEAQHHPLPLMGRGDLSSREDGSKSPGPQETGGTGSPPWILGQFPVLGHAPSLLPTAPAAPRPGSASVGPQRVQWKHPHKLCGPHPGVLAWALMEGMEVAGPLLLTLRSSVAPPQQGPDEKLRVSERPATCSGSHRCIRSG